MAFKIFENTLNFLSCSCKKITLYKTGAEPKYKKIMSQSVTLNQARIYPSQPHVPKHTCDINPENVDICFILTNLLTTHELYSHSF